MRSGGQDDPVGFVLGSLLELFKTFPIAGLAGSAAFAGLSLYIQRLPASLLHGKVHLLLVVTWPFAFLSLVMAAAGFIAQRRERVTRPTTAADLQALELDDFLRVVAELYRQRGFEVFPAPDPADLELRRQGLGKLLVFARLYRLPILRSADLAPIAATLSAWEIPAEAIVITCGELAPDALTCTQDRPLILVDANQLLDMLRLPPQVSEGQAAAAGTEPQ